MSRNIISGLLILLAVLAARAGTEPKDSQEIAQLVSQGDLFFKRNNFVQALDAYRKADKISKHTCASCYLRIFEVDRRLGDLSTALDDSKRAIKAAGDDKTLAIKALFDRATLLMEMAGKPSDKKLKEAEQEFREALALDPGFALGHFYLGTVLLRQERDDDGVAELKIFVATPGPNPKAVAMAQREIANPILGREPIAPDFSFSSLDGSTITNDGLRGKVVLLDFWATWCPPCRDSVPTLLGIRKKYAERPFEIVGVSADDDKGAWQAFVAAHHMDWPDHFDGGGSVCDLFNVHSFPTYIVLDRDGFIRFRESGFDGDVAIELEEAIDKALKRPPMLQPAAPPVPTAQN